MAFPETDLIPFFQWLFRTSVQASVLVCLILAVQALLRRKLGARWHYCLWLLLLVRLIMPGAPESSVSVFNLVPFGQQRHAAVAPEVIVPELAAASEARMPKPVPAPTTLAPAEAAGQPIPAQRAPFRVQPVPLIWALGALLVAIYAIGQNIALSSRIARQRQVMDEGVLGLLENCKETMGVRAYLSVVETPRVKSPALLGFIRPRLLLPEGMVDTLDRDELRYVFLHELAHLKRRDIAVNWLMAVLQLMHWFNPLIWYAFYRMRADREIACDALVLSRTQPGESKSYGRTIVSLLERFSAARRLPAVVGILEDKSQLRRRITMITHFRRDTYWRSTLAIVLLLTLSCVVLTDARGGQLRRGRSSVLPPDEEHQVLLEKRMEAMHKELDTRVSLDFAEGTDIRDILSFLSDFAGVNIVLDERVMFPPDGVRAAPSYFTVEMTPEASIPSDVVRVYLTGIPLRDALEALLKPTGLAYVVQPYFVWVSTPDVLKKETFTPVDARFTLPRAPRTDVDSLKVSLEGMRKRLRRNVSLDFAGGTDIRDVFSFLSDFAQVNIVLDERVMFPPAPPPIPPPLRAARRQREREGEDAAEEKAPGWITPNIPSEVRRILLQEMRVSDALKAFLSQIGLSYSVQPEFIWVSRPDILRRESFEPLETRQYTLQETDDPEKILAKLRNQMPDIVEPYTGEVLSSMELDSETRTLTVHHIPPRLKIVEEVLGVERQPVIERPRIWNRLGTEVSLDFSQGTDIRDVLSFLSDFAQVNIVLDERVMLPPAPPPPGPPGIPGPPRVTVGALPPADRADSPTRPAVGGIDRTIESEIRRIYLKSIPLGDALVAICKSMGLDYIALPEYVWVSRPDILRSEARGER